MGRHLGRNAVAGDIFLLTGPLGAGKTCLTQGIAWGLDVPGYARSPTFVLVTRHVGRMTLHHMDLFRIESPEEAWDLGMEELLSYSGPSDGVCVIEWADKFPELFPENSVHRIVGASGRTHVGTPNIHYWTPGDCRAAYTGTA